MPPIYKAMASGSSQATLPNRELRVKDLKALYEALYPVRAKYKFFGLQIGLDFDEIENIETNNKDSEHCLLKVLSVRLKQEPALTCADIDKALRSRTINECQLAKDFQSNFECKSTTENDKGSSMRKKATKSKESDNSLKISEKESGRIKRPGYAENESDSDNNIHKAGKYTEVGRQVHERDEPKSKRAKKRAHKKEKAAKNKCAIEQPEPDEYKEDERKQMKGKKQKMQMVASPQSGAKPAQKGKKSVNDSEDNSPEIMSTDSENELFDACKEKEILLSKSEKTGKIRESGAYSEVKHQPQSENEAIKMGKVPEKKESTRIRHSVLHKKIAMTVEDTSEQPSHELKKKLETSETDAEESKNTSDESESESLEHRKNLTPKPLTHKEDLYHDSVEEMEKVRDKYKKKISKLSVAESSPHSETLVGEEQYNQKKGKRSVDMKEQERESELRARASRAKLQKPHSELNERERVKEADSGKEVMRSVAHSTEQASDGSQTDSENEESDSGNDSSKAAVVPLKYDSLQGERQIYETCTRKVKKKEVSESVTLRPKSPGDDEQSDPDYDSRDQEEYDIPKKRRNKKKKRRESDMSPTAIGSSSPSTSREEKKKQPVCKKLGHRKKHVRKMKEKRERMKRGKEKAVYSSVTDDSSSECDMTKNQYEGDMRELVNIFERFFGKLCCAVFEPRDVAAELQSVGLISKSMMREMILSPESQQAKIIALVDELDKMIKSRPDHLFVIIKVMLKKETLQETAREILRQAGRKYFISVLQFISNLFPVGRVCPVETAANFPSQLPPSGTFVSPTIAGMHKVYFSFQGVVSL